MFGGITDRVVANGRLCEVGCKDLIPAADDMVDAEKTRNVGPDFGRHVKAIYLFVVVMGARVLRSESGLCEEAGCAAPSSAVKIGTGLAVWWEDLLVLVEKAPMSLGCIEVVAADCKSKCDDVQWCANVKARVQANEV